MENLSQRPKVEGSSPAAAASTYREKTASFNKTVVASGIRTVIEHSLRFGVITSTRFYFDALLL